MRIRPVAGALAAVQAVASQTLFTTLFVNDVDQGDGTCVRMPWYEKKATAPVTDLVSSDIACGYNGTLGVARVCPVPAGSTLTFQFKEYPDNSQLGVIGPGNKGPCSVYMKYVESAINDPGTGNGWFKIWEEGYDNSTSQWCTDRLLAENGLLSLILPSELAGGYYLVRTEIISLQQGDNTPAFYAGCVQVFLSSSAITLPKDVTNIPGYLNPSDPSLRYNIYAPTMPYVVPGPKTYMSQSSPTIQQPSVQNQNEGLLPSNVVITNANWFGIELDSYSTSIGCQNAIGSCLNQSNACYTAAGPIGTANCNIWNSRCYTMISSCQSGNYIGPPNKGQSLIQLSGVPIDVPSPTPRRDNFATYSTSVFNTSILTRSTSISTSLSNAIVSILSNTASTPVSSTPVSSLSAMAFVSVPDSLEIPSSSTVSTSVTRTPISILSTITPTSTSTISASIVSTAASVSSPTTTKLMLGITMSASNSITSVTASSMFTSMSLSSAASSKHSIFAASPVSETSVSTTLSISASMSSSGSAESAASLIISPSVYGTLATHSSIITTESHSSTPISLSVAISSASFSISTESAFSSDYSSSVSSPDINPSSKLNWVISTYNVSSSIPIASASVFSTTMSAINTVASSSASDILTSTSSILVTIATVTGPTLISTSEALRTEVVSMPSSGLSILSIQIVPISTNSTTSSATSTPTSLTATASSSSSSSSPAQSSNAVASANTPSPSSVGGVAQTATYSSNPSSSAKVSPDGTCGPEKGYTCIGTQDGPCCSSDGYCGATADYCGKMVCQPDWGQCEESSEARIKMIRHGRLHRKYWSTYA